MKYTLLLLLALDLWIGFLSAQTPGTQPTMEFELKLPQVRKKDKAHQIVRVSNSFYDHIDFLDSRPRLVIGPATKGLLKAPVDLVLKQPIENQLNTILSELIDSTSGNGDLLFQLRRFYYVEQFPTQFCFLEATIYNKTAGQYRKLLTMDTVFLIRDGDALDYMKAYACPMVSSFIHRALTLQPMDSTSYDLYAVRRMDSIERSRLPVFTDSSWVDGVYLSYQSFSQQLPDRQCVVTPNKSGGIRNIKMLDASGKSFEPKSAQLYAVVYKGQGFIATEYGYYPVTRTENALLFTGDVRIPPSVGDLSGAQFMLGLVGRYLASKGSRETYTMSLDHLNGEFLHMRLIPPPQTIN